MAKVYADLIRKGLKTIDDVPDRLKEKVYQELNYGFSGTLDMCTVYITD